MKKIAITGAFLSLFVFATKAQSQQHKPLNVPESERAQPAAAVNADGTLTESTSVEKAPAQAVSASTDQKTPAAAERKKTETSGSKKDQATSKPH